MISLVVDVPSGSGSTSSVSFACSSASVTIARLGGTVEARAATVHQVPAALVGCRCELWGPSGLAFSGAVSEVSAGEVSLIGYRDMLDSAVLNRRYISRSFANVTVSTLPGKEGFRWDIDSRECICSSEPDHNYASVEQAKDYAYVDAGGLMKRLVLDWSRNSFYKFWIYVEGAARVYRAGGDSDSGTLDYTCTSGQSGFSVFVANNATGSFQSSYPARFRFPNIYYHVATPTAANVLADALSASFPEVPPVSFGDVPSYTLDSEDTFETLGAIVDHVADASASTWTIGDNRIARFTPIEALPRYRVPSSGALSPSLASTYYGVSWRGGQATASSGWLATTGAPLARYGFKRGLVIDSDRPPGNVDAYVTGIAGRGAQTRLTLSELVAPGGQRVPAFYAKAPFVIVVDANEYVVETAEYDLVTGEVSVALDVVRLGRSTAPGAARTS